MAHLGVVLSDRGYELLQRISATFDLQPGRAVEVLIQLAADLLEERLSKNAAEFRIGRPREEEDRNARHMYCVLRQLLRKDGARHD